MHKLVRLQPLLFWVSILLLAGCSPDLRQQLTGDWGAIEVFEEGQPLPIDPSEITLSLQADSRYQFGSTLAYQENGVWQTTDDRFLLLRSETAHQGRQSPVQLAVGFPHPDTLEIEMVDSGKQRTLIMVRKKQQ